MGAIGLRSSRFLLFFAALFIIYHSSPERAEANENSQTSGDFTNSDMPIPGGLPVIAKLTGLNPGFLKSPSATERTFRCLLDSGPPVSGLLQINPARRHLLDYLNAYAQFLQHLRKEKLTPTGWDGSGSGKTTEISFPLSGGGADAEKIRKLLAYFGFENQPGTGSNSAGRRSNVSPNAPKHQDLPGTIGTSFQDKENREIRVTLQTGRLPLLPSAQVWDRIVPAGDKSDSLFERFLKNPAAMRLYVGLAGCAPAIREAVLNSINPRQLLRYADLLFLFGPSLKAKEGKISFPGSNRSWEDLLHLHDRGIAVSVQALLKNNGVPLLFYNSLASASPSVQAQIAGSPERLQSYYGVLKPYGSALTPGTSFIAVSEDLPRILRQVVAGPDGLHFAIEDGIARALVTHVAPEHVEESLAGHVLFTPAVLARLLPLPKASPYTQVSFGKVLELLRYLQDTHPGMLTDESVSVLVEAPEQSPIFLDLIGDIAAGPSLLSKYLDYCRVLSSNGPRGWNINRTRTSQSIFFLISALVHENAITQDKAGRLLDEALQSFQNDDEGVFAQAVAGFLSGKLLPEMSNGDGNAQDPLLSALSGQMRTDPITFQGSGIHINRAESRLQRMRETVQFQSYTPLGLMLEIYSTLGRIDSADSRQALDGALRLLSEQLNGIRAAERTPGGMIDKTKSIPQSQPNELKQTIETMANWSDSQPNQPVRARDLAAQLHAELSVSLLAYCYAYTEAAGLDVLAYDPNFIRKHRFYGPGLQGESLWAAAHFEQDEDVGGYIEGSLAGLGFELCRLQIAQATRAFSDEQETYLASAILLSSRQIPYQLRTDRSQEYVALMTRLGSELIRQPASEGQLHSWLRGHLVSLIPPQRIQEFEAVLTAGNPGAASDIFTRSELFLLGQAYFESQKMPLSSPRGTGGIETALNRLNSIIPDPGSDDYREFRQEVEQYGVFLRSRIGLSQLSFGMIDSYEQLENSLHPQYLYDRICDLKIRLAELNYELGLPASMAELETECAMREILSRTSQPYANTWRYAEESINMLTEQDVRDWIEEIRNRGPAAASNMIH
jgi:hypothetical protein